MPRARSPNRDKAFQLWIESQGRKSLQDIAAELGVKPEQVRSWKHADQWDAQTKKVTLPNGKGHVVKRKQGGQRGNRNAVGNNGGAPVGNKNNFRHGAYERVMAGLMETDEAEIFKDEETGLSIEAELRQTLAGLNAKEVRLMKHIAQVRKDMDPNAFLTSSSEEHRVGDEMSFDSDSVFKVSPFEALTKLEAELDKVQGRKIKVLAQLDAIQVSRERLNLEKKRLDGESEQSKLASAWIEALTGEELDEGTEEESAADEYGEID
ncbi:phage terminase small subunit [Acutalibacter muris]|uniref:phage terminase small subunit n=1 Tax=Acutalibacter muris TaxID=1796620 RepID=UPI002729A83D|nr:phage terminase small subunit [Acutalibacter muris]